VGEEGIASGENEDLQGIIKRTLIGRGALGEVALFVV